MPRLTVLPTLLREALGSRTLPREPEPDLVMDDPKQVAAYQTAGSADGLMAAAYLFHTARISQVIAGAEQVVDLGCGPAIQLAQVAAFNPGASFLGVDLSAQMLSRARDQVRQQGLGNVDFLESDITRLDSLDDASADAVISTMALHHLPTLDHLEACFRHIKRILRPGGSLYLTDFGRLKTLKSVIYFAYLNAQDQPHLFTLDYERSLRAAFLPEDFRRLTADALEIPAQVFTTFAVPILVIMKTEDRPLDPAALDRLKNMRRSLPSRYRRDLDDIRSFFRFGGLKNDPFR